MVWECLAADVTRRLTDNPNISSSPSWTASCANIPDNAERLAALKVMRVPKDLDPECLRILEERKDWKIEVPK
jgi:hypothetical protein